LQDRDASRMVGSRLQFLDNMTWLRISNILARADYNSTA
jgi:hypothetical protein